MSGVMEGRMEGRGGEGERSRSGAPGGRPGGGGGARWSARRTEGVVLRGRRGRAVALRRTGRSPGGRPGGALERAAQGGAGLAAAARRELGRAGPRGRAGGWHDQRVA